MEPSPLTKQQRPSVFQPKIAQLYDELFHHDGAALAESDGFWSEFFLLRPDRKRLQQRLEKLHSGELLELQHESQQLFRQAVIHMKIGRPPMGEYALDVRARLQSRCPLATYLSDLDSLPYRGTR